jgi:hypothetical protein
MDVIRAALGAAAEAAREAAELPAAHQPLTAADSGLCAG